MEHFDHLGERVLAAWSRARFDHRALPEVAAETLVQVDFDGLKARDILRWVQTADALPHQGNLDSRFGQPPIVVFWNPRFYVEVLFWHTATTSIHQHGFSGAFTLLEGSSVESRYHFEEAQRINDHVLVGQIECHHTGLLRRGDVRPIHSGRALIHSVFHLETPSVTVVVRSNQDPGVEPQYEYRPPHLAVDPFHKDPLATRRVQCLELLWRLGDPGIEDAVATSLRHADPLGAVRILDQAMNHAEDEELIARLVAVAREHHGAWIHMATRSLEVSVRTRIVHTRRELIADEDHRYLLALLATSHDRDTILSMVRERAPERDPIDTVVDWATSMSGTEVVGIEFDELNIEIFRHLLAGVPAGEIPQRLAETYEPSDIEAQRSELDEHIAAMRRSQVFGPLLDTSHGSASGGGSAGIEVAP